MSQKCQFRFKNSGGTKIANSSAEAKNGFKQNLGHKAFFLGLRAEALAAFWLRLKVYHIIARRYKTRCGEIDIIARKGTLIAITEIKARPNLRQAIEAVDRQSQKRIIAAADLWLAHQADYNKLCLRFDLIAICPHRLPHHIKAFFTT